jgi:hypothetical protein
MKGIIFSEHLFKRAVRGEKTQWREIVKPQPGSVFMDNPVRAWFPCEGTRVITPRYLRGETLYLKEPYCFAPLDKESREAWPELSDYIYKYFPNMAADSYLNTKEQHIMAWNLIKWKSARSMPQKHARYFIKITCIRCERVQDISAEDCLMEGIKEIDVGSRSVYQWRESIGPAGAWCHTPQQAYACLIDDINDDNTWESNPYVWVYEFEIL